jgi:phosphoglycerate kinase
MKTLNQFNFKNLKALIRVDFNVPLNDNFEVTDASRIIAAKPTIIKILEDGGSCVLMSHLGRPNGIQEEFSLKHIADKVEDIIGVETKFVDDCVGDTAEKAVAELQPGQLLILENLRFHNEETTGDKKFAEQLSRLGDIYVNDAFGTAHRAHASTTIVANYFKDKKCFGLLLEKEINSIEKVMETGEKPILAIIGGAKVSSKITIIENILTKIDHLIIGGGMAFTFVKAQGGQIGNSLVEEDKLDLALSILKKAEKHNVQIHIPVDAVIADAFSNDAHHKVCDINNIPDGWMGLDAGPQSTALFHNIVLESKTILWNGPLGVFELENFANGTISLGNSISESTKKGAFSLVGGGDSVAAVKQFGLAKKVSYVSTGGGAMLESLEGKDLPGIAAILK